jgi:hypothetical protein
LWHTGWEAAGCSESYIAFFQTTRHYIPEDSNLREFTSSANISFHMCQQSLLETLQFVCSSGNLKERDHLEDVDVNERMLLKLILKE